MSKQTTGNYGEALALTFLTERGYLHVESNWRCPYGEIDIIAQDQNTLVFVEVRTRHSATTETAFASITPRKREKIITSSHLYLETHQYPHDTDWRIDIIAVSLSTSHKETVEHIEDALNW